jgi:hypothetical protein
MKLQALTLAGSRHLRINGVNETTIDSEKFDIDADFDRRIVLVTPLNSHKGKMGKQVWTPFESVGCATPADETDPPDALAERRKLKRETLREPMEEERRARKLAAREAAEKGPDKE